MARRRRSQRLSLGSTLFELRDPIVIANQRLELEARRRTAVDRLESLRKEFLREIEDRRRFDPEGVRARPRNLIGRVAAFGTIGSGRSSFVAPVAVGGFEDKGTRSRQRYGVPAVVCVRRKVRREVLFAKGVGGGRVRRVRRRNVWSDVNC